MRSELGKKSLDGVLAIFRLVAPHTRSRSWKQSMTAMSLNALLKSFVTPCHIVWWA